MAYSVVSLTSNSKNDASSSCSIFSSCSFVISFSQTVTDVTPFYLKSIRLVSYCIRITLKCKVFEMKLYHLGIKSEENSKKSIGKRIKDNNYDIDGNTYMHCD